MDNVPEVMDIVHTLVHGNKGWQYLAAQTHMRRLLVAGLAVAVVHKSVTQKTINSYLREHHSLTRNRLSINDYRTKLQARQR